MDAELQDFLTELESCGLLGDDAEQPAAAVCNADTSWAARDVSPDRVVVEDPEESPAAAASPACNPAAGEEKALPDLVDIPATSSSPTAASVPASTFPQQGPEQPNEQVSLDKGAQEVDRDASSMPAASTPISSANQPDEPALEQFEQRVLGPLAGAEEWYEVMDAATGGVYFWHATTDAVEWQPPKGSAPRDHEMPEHSNVEVLTARLSEVAGVGGASDDAAQDEGAKSEAIVSASQPAGPSDPPPVTALNVPHDSFPTACGAVELETAGVAHDVAAWTDSLLLYLRSAVAEVLPIVPQLALLATEAEIRARDLMALGNLHKETSGGLTWHHIEVHILQQLQLLRDRLSEGVSAAFSTGAGEPRDSEAEALAQGVRSDENSQPKQISVSEGVQCIQLPSGDADHAAGPASTADRPTHMEAAPETVAADDKDDSQVLVMPNDGVVSLTSPHYEREEGEEDEPPLPPNQEALATLVPQYGDHSPSRDQAVDMDDDEPEDGEIRKPRPAGTPPEIVDHMDVDQDAADDPAAGSKAAVTWVVSAEADLPLPASRENGTVETSQPEEEVQPISKDSAQPRQLEYRAAPSFVEELVYTMPAEGSPPLPSEHLPSIQTPAVDVRKGKRDRVPVRVSVLDAKRKGGHSKGSKSSLISKWQSVQQDLKAAEAHAAAAEADAADPEMAVKRRAIEAEEWRLQYLRSGQAADNPNFQPVAGDWRDKVKATEKAEQRAARKAAKIASKTSSASVTSQPSDSVALSKGLPEGWLAMRDASDGSIYYGNLTTKETTWDRPSA